MEFLLAFFILTTIAASVFAWMQMQKVREREHWLNMATPYVVLSGAAFEEIEPLIQWSDWEFVEESANNGEGFFANRGLCPCQHEYTVRTAATRMPAAPTAAQKAACLAAPPAPRPALLKCPDNCVQVMTHIWNGYSVMRNRRTGQFQLNCNRFAQYHCKLPDDPDRNRKPQEGPPNPNPTTIQP